MRAPQQLTRADVGTALQEGIHSLRVALLSCKQDNSRAACSWARHVLRLIISI